MLIVAIKAKIAFKCLVGTLGLTIRFGMICGREVELHVEKHKLDEANLSTPPYLQRGFSIRLKTGPVDGEGATWKE